MNADCYFDFEEAFRGSRNEILGRLSGYEGLLAELIQQREPRALDLGCGRGEWLQILHRYGFIAIGIDRNSRFIEQCRALKLQVACADVFEYLRGIPDHSYSLLSAFHLIEHLSHAQIGLLISEAHRVLRPDGVLLLETPSIDNLLVASKSFYSDPTHTTPIHPEGLCFSLQQAGFAWSTAIYLNGGIETDASHDQITRLFNGVAQDVCILASPLRPDISFLEAAQWQRQLHRAPTSYEVLYQYNQALVQSLMQLEQRIQQLQAWQAANDVLLRRIDRCSDLVRWWLHPLLLLRRQSRRWTASLQQPHVLLEQTVQETVRNSRRHRAILSTLLKRVGLYHVSLAIYQRMCTVNPVHNPLHLTPVERLSCAARAERIDADLARLGIRKREVS